MQSFLNKKLVIAATAVAVLGGAGVAVAATQSSSGSGEQAYINDLAGRLDVTPSALTAAIKAADNDQINAALAAKRLTQAEATALEQRIQQSSGAPFLGAELGRGLGRAGFRGGLLANGTAAAAQYLGISEAALRAELAAGQSLDAIANATADKSAVGLKAAIIAAQTKQLNAAAGTHKITSQQEQKLLSNLSNRIDALLARSGTGPAGRWGRAGTWTRRGATGASGSSLFGSSPSA